MPAIEIKTFFSMRKGGAIAPLNAPLQQARTVSNTATIFTSTFIYMFYL